jgi:Colicin V production protein
MWFDALALAVLAAFAGMGAVRGALATGTGLASLALGYTAGLLAAARLGAGASQRLGLPAMLGPAVAGSLAFALAFVAASLLSHWLKRRERERRGDLPRTAGDRAGGAALGAVRGLLVVLLLGLLVSWVDAAREMGGSVPLPPAEDSLATRLTGQVVESGVEAALADAGPSGRMAARLAARPASTLQGLQGLLEDERLHAVQEDRLFWTYIEHGAVDNAMNRLSFAALARDPAFRRQMAELGLVSDAAAEDFESFRDEARAVLEQVGPRIQGLRNDEELQRLADDPEIVALLQSGDTLGLVTHPRFQAVVARLLDGSS